jgi:RNA-directed DNA polymerase
MGLELKPSKTKITHTLCTHNGNVGFDFLGFVRHESCTRGGCG